MSKNRPAITHLGKVEMQPDGHTVLIKEWALGICFSECRCHIHPMTEQLTIPQKEDGSLGLTKYYACDCCDPWTAKELTNIVELARELQELETTS